MNSIIIMRCDWGFSLLVFFLREKSFLTKYSCKWNWCVFFCSSVWILCFTNLLRKKVNSLIDFRYLFIKKNHKKNMLFFCKNTLVHNFDIIVRTFFVWTVSLALYAVVKSLYAFFFCKIQWMISYFISGKANMLHV